MAKGDKSVFVCQSCGARHPRWLGQCSECGTWNSLVEESAIKPSARSKSGSAFQKKASGDITERVPAKIIRLGESSGEITQRTGSGFASVDRVLGGGFVPGSLLLFGGEPGIGKSTLLLQLVGKLTQSKRCLYVSGEESGAQVGARAHRLEIRPHDRLQFLSTLSLETLLEAIENTHAEFVVVDSMQTFQSEFFESVAGSVSQVRALCHSLVELSKTKNVTVLMVGQVTKEGSIAGPKLVEHMVDAVFSFEMASHGGYRILKAQKNRFGAVNEMAVFEMGSRGMQEVLNPSERFLQERNLSMAGSTVVCQQEGTQVLLSEVQALVSKCHVGYPRRTTQGVDANRLSVLLAVAERNLNQNFSDQDVYCKVASGGELQEPAADLALLMCLWSARKDKVLPADALFVGEVGLGGELRSVPAINARIKEALALGFRKFFVPRGNRLELEADTGLQSRTNGVEFYFCRDLAQVLSVLEKLASHLGNAGDRSRSLPDESKRVSKEH